MFSLLLGLGLVLFTVPLSAQSLPNKKEVSQWVRKALDANILQDSEGSPYHFVATIRYTLGEKSFAGKCEVLWAAPDRHRVEFRLGDTRETDVVLGDKRYVVRNTATMTLAMWAASSLLFPQNPVVIPAQLRSDSIHKLFPSDEGSAHQTCAIVGDHTSLIHEMCFDAATSEITSRQVHPNPHGALPKEPLSLDLTEYVSLGKMRFPKHLVRRVGPELICVDLEKWEAVPTFGADAFVQPANATEWDWCSKPEIRLEAATQSSLLVPSLTATGALEGPYLLAYKMVGQDGTTKQVVELFGPQNDAAKDFLSRQRRQRSALHVCGGKTVAYETIVPFGMLPGR